MRARSTLIFAYGTLRPGCGNDRMLGNYQHVGTGTVPGRLYLHACGMFPVYVPSNDGATVQGDLLLADDQDVANVAAMEVFAGYNAEWSTVTLDNGDEMEALTFPWRRKVYADDLIEHGDWYMTPHASG